MFSLFIPVAGNDSGPIFLMAAGYGYIAIQSIFLENSHSIKLISYLPSLQLIYFSGHSKLLRSCTKNKNGVVELFR